MVPGSSERKERQEGTASVPMRDRAVLYCTHVFLPRTAGIWGGWTRASSTSLGHVWALSRSRAQIHYTYSRVAYKLTVKF